MNRKAQQVLPVFREQKPFIVKYNQSSRLNQFLDESNKNVFGMMVGIGYGKLRSNDLNDPEFNFKPSYTKYAGVTLDVPIPALEKRGYFFSELSFSQYTANSFVHLPDTTLGHPERDFYEITQKFAPNTLTLVNTFRYCFVNRDFKYYVSAGISNSFLISPENKKTTVNFRNGETKSEVESFIPDYAVHGIMLIVGTGITYKYIGLELRYDPGRNYTRKVDYSIHQPIPLRSSAYSL
ncbi:MAG: hypothetical protein IPH45_20280 [Bacteroidales bacterium]|nr:hypothetical protein [Bacteroidales bacterium]